MFFRKQRGVVEVEVEHTRTPDMVDSNEPAAAEVEPDVSNYAVDITNLIKYVKGSEIIAYDTRDPNAPEMYYTPMSYTTDVYTLTFKDKTIVAKTTNWSYPARNRTSGMITIYRNESSPQMDLFEETNGATNTHIGSIDRSDVHPAQFEYLFNYMKAAVIQHQEETKRNRLANLMKEFA